MAFRAKFSRHFLAVGWSVLNLLEEDRELAVEFLICFGVFLLSSPYTGKRIISPYGRKQQILAANAVARTTR